MISQSFQASPLPYQYLCSQFPPSLFGALYDPALCTLPRIWAEEVNFLSSMSVVPRKLVGSDFAIWITATMNQRWWPGWGVKMWEINGMTGQFIRFLNIPSDLGTVGFQWATMTRAGRMWIYQAPIGIPSFNEFFVTPDAPDGTPVLTPTGVTMSVSFAGTWDSRFMAIDEYQNICFITTGATPVSCISIHNFTTGALIRHVPVCGKPLDVHQEGDTRAYVVSTTGVITFIDWTTGEVQSITKFGLPSTTFLSAYNQDLKRLLYLPNTPNNADGSSTLRVLGYKNIPVATRVTKPVVLAKPRTGQRIQTAARLVGEVGEIPPSIILNGSLSNGNATLINPATMTDGDGYANFEIDCNSAGSVDLTVSGAV